MAFHSMFVYTGARAVQNSAIRKLGAPVTIFKSTKPIVMQGYENLETFDQFPERCFIDFHVKRRVFYHFNWFPENEDQITLGYFPLESPVAADWFVRTKQIGELSPYGDIIFKIVKVGDDGKYQPLKRTVFMTALTDAVLYEKLQVKPPKVVSNAH